MQLETLFAEALGIKSPWRIRSLAFDAEAKKLDIEVDFEPGSTFEYQDPQTQAIKSYKAYDTIQKTWRHLNFVEHECYLHAGVPRIKPNGGGIKMVPPPWRGVVHGFTLLFESLVLQMCKNMPVHNASKILGVSDHKLWHVLDRYVLKAKMHEDFSKVSVVGMDETSVRKGHDYITMFVDMQEKRTLFITEGKDHKTVEAFVKNLEAKGGDHEAISDVSCDMSPAFIKGVDQSLPYAQITFDKFHVVKQINEGVSAVRQSEVKDNPILKGSRYALLKNEKTLTEKQKVIRHNLSQLNLQSIQALHMRENFQEIYKADSAAEFEHYLERWYEWVSNCGISAIVKVAEMVRTHWDGILRWKESQINNGILEGLNSVIQAAKRKARGYKVEHFKVMAYLLTGKLDLHQVNPYLPT